MQNLSFKREGGTILLKKKRHFFTLEGSGLQILQLACTDVKLLLSTCFL